MRTDATWFRKCGWGAFTHYLTGSKTTADDWNRQVDSFDVDRLADELEQAGARYYFITIGQTSGHYCSPNETYDSIVGVSPSKCSRRDLVGDICDALAPRGIKLLVYLASEGPGRDVMARQRLGWLGRHWGEMEPGQDVVETWSDKRQVAFQENWEAVIREWSTRWGPRVRGWWMDGCWHKDVMYGHPDPPNFASFAAALKAGNPDSIVAFNPAVKVPIISWTEHEDYTAGEIDGALPVGDWVGDSSEVGGAQYHILTFLGRSWSTGPPRFPDEMAPAYTRFVVGRGGVITWDVPIETDGRIPEPFVRQLAAIGRGLREGHRVGR